MLLLSAAATLVLCTLVAAAGLPPWIAAPFALAAAALLPASARRRRLPRVAVACASLVLACWYLPARLSPARPGGVATLAGQNARLLVRAEDDGDIHPTYTAVTAAVLAR